MNKTSQRLDKWLWYVRLVKSRSKAGQLIAAGKVRINQEKITKPAHPVKPDDVVTAMVNRNLRILKIVDIGQRRGPAREAAELYEDLTPAPPTKEEKAFQPAPAAKREAGAGRPTKRERRQTDRFRKAAEPS